MRPQDTLSQLDQLIASHSILQHPFYQAWSAGQLKLDDLAIYAWAYYPHVEAFPGYIQLALEQTDDATLTTILQDNLREELDDAHPELWLQFAAGLGVDRQEVIDAQPTPEVKQAIETFQRLCTQDAPSALAALYAYESQQPEVSCSKIKGLKEFYQIHDPQTLEYFEVHEEADIRHREEERLALQHCLEDGADPHELFEAAQAALDAHWLLLDGVCRQAGLAC